MKEVKSTSEEQEVNNISKEQEVKSISEKQENILKARSLAIIPSKEQTPGESPL